MRQQIGAQQSFVNSLQEPEAAPLECLGERFQNDEERRAFFIEQLKAKLKDPDFRRLEGFPLGADDDILGLSDPPYHTACPNPFVSALLKEHYKPHVPETDDYRVEPYTADVREGKQDPVCMAHTYHTKVPYRAIARYILHYTKEGDIVLDSFAGTGMTALATSLCTAPDPAFRQSVEQEAADAGRGKISWGRRTAVLFELSPFATFLARNFNSRLSVRQFASEAEGLISSSQAAFNWLYSSGVEDVTDDSELQFVVWVDVFNCECGQPLKFWDPVNPEKLSKNIETTIICKACRRINTKKTLQQVHTTVYDPIIQKVVSQNRQDISFLEVKKNGIISRRRPSQFDLRLLERINSEPIPHSFPAMPMMFKESAWGDMYRSGYHFGVTHAHQFWTRRNLIVLSDLFAKARSSKHPLEMLFLCTSFAVKTGSRMHNIGLDDGKLNLAGQIYNTLQIPGISAERNLFELARSKAKDLEAVFSMHKRNHPVISTASATHLIGVPDNAVDYVFVDPPFGENIKYSELSFLYEAWLRVFTQPSPEAIISDSQEKDIYAYKDLMAQCFRELYRVLKPGRWITVAFHNSKNAVWNVIQETLGEARFVIADVRMLDKGQATYKQMTTAGAVKQDLVISAYKPNGGLEHRFELAKGSEDGAWDFVRTHLKQLPVAVAKGGTLETLADRQAFMLFDRMVAFHVLRGVMVPLSAGDFYRGLAARFHERDGMYFLSDQLPEYERKRMNAREVLQLDLFVSDEASAIQWLRQQLTTKPQSFQDIQPQFMRETQGKWQKHELPLELSVLLEENFLRYDGQGDVPTQIHSYLSTNFKDMRNLPKDAEALRRKAKDRWYVPDPAKVGDLEKLRERTLLRDFGDYCESKQKKLKVFRIEAVRAGFRRAWQQNDYATILTVSEKLPEDVVQEDRMLLMWYTNSLTRSGRQS